MSLLNRRVILVENFRLKFLCKLDHSFNNSEARLASFHAFRSDISSFLGPILSKSKPGSDFISLQWIHQCFDVIPLIHNAFSQLVVGIDYPMSKWKAIVSDEYLNYTLKILEFLNIVSVSLSHLDFSRLSFSHALALHQNSPSLTSGNLQESRANKPDRFLKVEDSKKRKECLGFGKEYIIHEALMIMKKSGILLFGIIISGLSSDARNYLGVRISAMELNDPFLENLDSNFNQEIVENGCVIKEIKEINQEVAAQAHLNDGNQGLSAKLEALERFLQSMGKQNETLFSDVLETRNKLLDNFRYKEEHGKY